MSNTLQHLKDAQLAARKARDGVRATLLTTIIGEAGMVGKNERNGDPTESEVVGVLKKFEKNAVETLKFLSAGQSDAAIAQYEAELKILREFLPAKMTDLQVQKDIGTAMQELGIAKAVQKDQGAIVKILRAKYGDQFDGAQVSQVFKAMIV